MRTGSREAMSDNPTHQSNAGHGATFRAASAEVIGQASRQAKPRPLRVFACRKGRGSATPVWQPHTWLANAGWSGGVPGAEKLATVLGDCVAKRTDKKTSRCFAETCAWRGG